MHIPKNQRRKVAAVFQRAFEIKVTKRKTEGLCHILSGIYLRTQYLSERENVALAENLLRELYGPKRVEDLYGFWWKSPGNVTLRRPRVPHRRYTYHDHRMSCVRAFVYDPDFNPRCFALLLAKEIALEGGL